MAETTVLIPLAWTLTGGLTVWSGVLAAPVVADLWRRQLLAVASRFEVLAVSPVPSRGRPVPVLARLVPGRGHHRWTGVAR